MTLLWTNDWKGQRDEIATLNSRIELVDRAVSPATVIDSSSPDSDAINSAWQRKKDAVISAPPKSKTHWFNPETNAIENIYPQLDAVSPTPTPIMDEGKNSNEIELIQVYHWPGNLGTVDITPTKDYATIRFLMRSRLTVNATAGLLILRTNGNATANQRYLGQEVLSNNTFFKFYSAAETSLGGTRLSIPGSISSSYVNAYAFTHVEFHWADAISSCMGRHIVVYDDGASANEVRLINFYASNVSVPFSFLRVSGNGNIFSKGSWIAAYGINPL